ncbi:hypothetical protein Q9Q94_11575 [Uliginosibacterium sp. 31-16]|uniref:hypothetical protein n=1 Tax=Uliginosibacterium sp. 31-16 TaxID=3068315 RepID=UPI00273DA46C|nr:hypothetical protein [Uliginosibacterium sp. 31-16]MDP5240172.1 hypothetical protein [Uliginosibacterium sp. 31-16]
MAADTTQQTLPADPMADLAPRDVQLQAARLVHEAFAAALRLSADGEGKQLEDALARLASHLREWSRMATTEAAHLRMALLLSGLDQWGLAYSKAFGAATLAGLSAILADLRDSMDLAEEGACQHFLDALHADETAALEFKIAFRRELHLSLWHTMIAAENREQAEVLLKLLGGMLLALNRAMPNLGWRLVADASASIQIRCLQHGLAASGLEQEMTENLFAGLQAELPEAERELVNQLAAEAVSAWQEARRSTQH